MIAVPWRVLLLYTVRRRDLICDDYGVPTRVMLVMISMLTGTICDSLAFFQAAKWLATVNAAFRAARWIPSLQRHGHLCWVRFVCRASE